jgi:hypothetical protein
MDLTELRTPWVPVKIIGGRSEFNWGLPRSFPLTDSGRTGQVSKRVSMLRKRHPPRALRHLERGLDAQPGDMIDLSRRVNPAN